MAQYLSIRCVVNTDRTSAHIAGTGASRRFSLPFYIPFRRCCFDWGRAWARPLGLPVWGGGEIPRSRPRCPDQGPRRRHSQFVGDGGSIGQASSPAGDLEKRGCRKKLEE